MKIKLIFTIFTILIVALLRVQFDNSIIIKFSEFKTYGTKINDLSNAQTILIGDSRVLNGIDPTFFKPMTLNFAFSSNSFTKNYLEYIKNNHGPNLKKVFINLSVQALSDFQLDHSFRTYIKGSYNQLSLIKTIFLQPINIWNLKETISYSKETLHRNKGYFSLGEKENNLLAAQAYIDSYKQNKFNPKYLDYLVDFKNYMNNKNIDVQFLQLPSKANKYDFDKRYSGIDLIKFENLLIEKNINTIKIPLKIKESLKFVDGDHLTRESTVLISTWLATQ